MKTKLYIVIPCYNEAEVLPITVPLFLEVLADLIKKEKISKESRILFVDDGSSDATWQLILKYAKSNAQLLGIRLSRNYGHQYALFAGLMEVKEKADIAITIDCDGQDDVSAMESMVERYHEGYEIVYGVRTDRGSDCFLKRASAHGFYKLMQGLGADMVYDHADYRLLSGRVLKELERFKEQNLFLRGMIPLLGFRHTTVYYERQKRLAGKTKYSVRKMFGLALEGITSLSIQPLRFLFGMGLFAAVCSLLGATWALIRGMNGAEVYWELVMTCALCFVGGMQLIGLGIIGEYIGKIYIEVKGRPRYIVEEWTENCKNLVKSVKKD